MASHVRTVKVWLAECLTYHLSCFKKTNLRILAIIHTFLHGWHYNAEQLYWPECTLACTSLSRNFNVEGHAKDDAREEIYASRMLRRVVYLEAMYTQRGGFERTCGGGPRRVYKIPDNQ